MSLVESLAHTHSQRILKALRESHHGLTDFEIADQLGIYLSSVNAARNVLVRRGEVKDSKRDRPSGRGGRAIIWVATDEKEAPA